MSIWRWVFKIAIQIIPILLGIDWRPPRHNEKLIPKYGPPRYKKRRFFD